MEMKNEKMMTGYASIDQPWLKYYPEGAEKIEEVNLSLLDLLQENNKDNLGSVALNYKNTSYNVTYEQLFKRMNIVGRALGYDGFEKGRVLPVISLPTPETVYTFLGAGTLGAPTNMLSPSFTPNEMFAKIQESDSDTIILLSELYPKYGEVVKDSDVKKIVILGATEPFWFMKNGKPLSKDEREISWRKYISKYRKYDKFPTHEFTKNEHFSTVYSSGSTGLPKGIMLGTDAYIKMYQYYMNTGSGFSKDDIFYHTIPFNHSTGQNISLMMPLLFGAKVVLDPPFDAKRFAEGLIKSKATISVGPATHYEGLAQSEEAKKADWSHSPVLFAVGEKLDELTKRECDSILLENGSKLPTQVGGGQCEAGPTIMTSLPIFDIPEISAGKPLPGINYAAFDMETLREKKYNERGLLFVRTDARMIGYYKNEEATLKYFFKKIGNKMVPIQSLDELNDKSFEIWGCTGDIGYTDEEGNCYYLGRENDSIKNQGKKTIYLFDIENVIKRHPAIEKVEVVKMMVDGEYKPVAHLILRKDYLDKVEQVLIELNNLCQNYLETLERPVAFKLREAFKQAISGKRDIESLELEIDGFLVIDGNDIKDVTIENDRIMSNAKVLKRENK